MISKEVNNLFSEEIKELAENRCQQLYSLQSIEDMDKDSLQAFMWGLTKWNELGPASLTKDVNFFVMSLYRQEILKSAFQSLQPTLDPLFGDLDDYVYFLQGLSQAKDVTRYLIDYKDNIKELKSMATHDVVFKYKMTLTQFDQVMNEYTEHLKAKHIAMLQTWFTPEDDTFLPERFEETDTDYVEEMISLNGDVLIKTGLPATDPLYKKFDEIITSFHNHVLDLMDSLSQDDLDINVFDSDYQHLLSELKDLLREAYLTDTFAQRTPSLPLDKLVERRKVFSEFIQHLKGVAKKIQEQPTIFLNTLQTNKMIENEENVHWKNKIDILNQEHTVLKPIDRASLKRTASVLN